MLSQGGFTMKQKKLISILACIFSLLTPCIQSATRTMHTTIARPAAQLNLAKNTAMPAASKSAAVITMSAQDKKMYTIMAAVVVVPFFVWFLYRMLRCIRPARNAAQWWKDLFRPKKKEFKELKEVAKEFGIPHIEHPHPNAQSVTMEILRDEEPHSEQCIEKLKQLNKNAVIPLHTIFDFENALVAKKICKLGSFRNNGEIGTKVEVKIARNKDTSETIGCIIFSEQKLQGNVVIYLLTAQDKDKDKILSELLNEVVKQHQGEQESEMRCKIPKGYGEDFLIKQNFVKEKQSVVPNSQTGTIYTKKIPSVRKVRFAN